MIDSNRLFSIVYFNSLSSSYNDDTEIHSQNDPLKEENQGLWIVPAYFNHSCLPNTISHFFSDLMMIYTSNLQIIIAVLLVFLYVKQNFFVQFQQRDIKKGEELTVSYAGKTCYNYPFRSYSCQSAGFECQCELCVVDRADLDGTIERDASVFAQNRNMFASQAFDVNSAQKFVDRAKSTYHDGRAEYLKTSCTRR
jgi:hypothetical protein